MIDSKQPIVMFTAHDRCDRCGSQAYFIFYRDNLDLLFCMHHSKKHMDALVLDDWKFQYDADAIDRLTDNNHKITV